MTEREFQDVVADALERVDMDEPLRIQTFEELGMLATDHGLVVRDLEGNEFQLTIVRRR